MPSTARALPAVVDTVGDDVEALVDGGVRTGLDVVKMLALGARAVARGTSVGVGGRARGEAGVRHMLEVMKADIDTALGLTGRRPSPLWTARALRGGAPVAPASPVRSWLRG